MRLSGLSLAAVLLLSSLAFAQHQTAAPPPPPPPPPPAAVPAPESHISAPSAPSTPAPASAPATHVDTGHFDNSSTPSNPAPASSMPAAHTPEPDRVAPDQKIVGDEKIESAPRVGEDEHSDIRTKDTPEKEKEARAEPDLRRHICGDKPCQSPEPKPVEPDKERKRRPCEKQPCPCPPGEKASGGGCVATVVENNGQCQPGQVWSVGSCIARTCPHNETWDGTRCVASPDQCLALEGAAARLISQLRALKTRMQEVCAQDPSSQDCADLTQEHDRLREQYRALWNQASPFCRGRLPDPDTL